MTTFKDFAKLNGKDILWANFVKPMYYESSVLTGIHNLD